MFKRVGFNDFRDAFHNMGRDNHFSYEGLRILFDWIEQLDEDTGQDTELDVIALCCEFDEMNEQELRDTYDIDSDVEVEDFLNDNTMVCGSYDAEGDKFYIFQQF